MTTVGRNALVRTVVHLYTVRTYVVYGTYVRMYVCSVMTRDTRDPGHDD